MLSQSLFADISYPSQVCAKKLIKFGTKSNLISKSKILHKKCNAKFAVTFDHRYFSHQLNLQLIWGLVRMQVLQLKGEAFYKIADKITTLLFAFIQCMLVLSLYQSWIISTIVR